MVVAILTLTLAAVGVSGCGDGTDGSDGGSDTDVRDTGADDASDSGSTNCPPDAGDTCSCDFQGLAKGVCNGSTVSPSGDCSQPADWETRETSCADGLDNDCDGKVDCADPSCAGATCGQGQGSAICIANECKELVCYDGIDNDGDGSTDCADPECAGDSCKQGTGRKCPPPDSWEPDGEMTCTDQLDNDCDGIVNETCACTYDPTESNKVDTDETNDAGVCTGQMRSKNDGICSKPEGFEAFESSCADGLDNDCDGATGCEDPNCVGEVCDSDTGAVCPRPSNYEPGGETSCDGVDNDCDGVVDENCPCTYDPTETKSVDTNGSHGTGVCTGQTADKNGACPKPSSFQPRTVGETCDGLDNDCDGQTDEGCDDDGDGVCDASRNCKSGASCSCSPADCYDQNPEVKPGQTKYFGRDRGDGSFDYDCDGNETKRYTASGSCTSTGYRTCGVQTSGWLGFVPSCGGTTQWIKSCSYDPVANNCQPSGSYRTQVCR